MEPRKLVTDAVIGWLQGTPVDRLEAQATSGSDVVVELARTYGPWIPVLRFVIGPSALDQIESMGTEDYNRLLNEALLRVPGQAMVCYAHPDWYQRQCRAIQQAILDHASHRRRTGGTS